MDFFKSLEKELAPGIDKIINHPFVDLIAEGKLSKKQLQYFAEQYAVYCSYFPRFLAAAAANIPDDATRMPIVENLWEEHGEGKLDLSHRILYNRFARGTGLAEATIAAPEPLPTTMIVCENLFNLCQDGHFLESLGALGPGTEYFTNEEYARIEKGLKKYDFLTKEAIYFWTVHITLDATHYSEMVDAIAPWSDSLEHKFLIKQGAKKAIDLEILFWDGLEDNLPID